MSRLIKLRKGSIGVLVDSGTLTEKVIERFTGESSHVFCYVGDGEITEALFREGVVRGGIERYMVDHRMFVVMFEPREDVFSDDDVENVCKKWLDDVGKRYDVRTVLSHAFSWLKKRNDHMRICSEHAAHGYEGLHKFRGKHYSECSPHDIFFDQAFMGYDKFRLKRLYDLK